MSNDLTQTLEKYDLTDSAPLLTVLFDKLSLLDDKDKADCISTALGKAMSKVIP